MSAGWFPLMTTNTIGFPPMNCKGLIFESTEDSTLTVYAPPHVISRTSPQPKSRSEGLDGKMETITLPVAFGWNRPPSAQIEVVAPFLQNTIGSWLITGAAWEPFKWLLLALEPLQVLLLRPALRPPRHCPPPIHTIVERGQPSQLAARMRKGIESAAFQRIGRRSYHGRG